MKEKAMRENEKENLAALAQQLIISQTEVEQMIFNAFNQQDKQLTVITRGIELLAEISSAIDAISFEIEDITMQIQALAEETKDNKVCESMDGLVTLAVSEFTKLQELSDLFEKLKQGQESSLNYVHSMEEEIANQRICLDEISSVCEENDE